MDVPDIRDIRNPPPDLSWIWWALLALVCLAVAAWAYRWWKNRKPKPVKPVVIDLPTAWDLALARLDALEKKNYCQAGAFKTFYIELSDILRHYLEDRFGIKAPEMTTEEFLNNIRRSLLLKEDHTRHLEHFLNGSDMVKFARHTPAVADAQANFELAKRLILETKNGI